MTSSIDLATLRERVRDALDMYQVATFDGLTLRKSGNGMWTCACPFHTDNTASFIVGGKWKDRYHCFGCGADGDMFDYWQQRRGVDHAEAVKQLAGLGGVYVGEVTFEKPKAGVKRSPEKRLDDGADAAQKPSLPPLYQATREDCEAIAKGRKLDPEAVWIAARVHKRVAIAKSWPMYQARYDNQWHPKQTWEQHRCWAAIDETRNVAEFRRIDNGLHTKLDGTASPKVWSTAGKNWPLGAGQIGDRKRVLLVEGGPDMLAAYHFLRIWHTQRRPLLQDVAVVCMLGASNKIREEALPHFKGCRVRIMVDADTPKDDEVKAKRKLVGAEAAARWQDQLSEAGATVETFCVGDVFDRADLDRWHEGELLAAEIKIRVPGYLTQDGAKVKDLNDLAKCGEDVAGSDDVRQAMTDWDF